MNVCMNGINATFTYCGCPSPLLALVPSVLEAWLFLAQNLPLVIGRSFADR